MRVAFVNGPLEGQEIESRDARPGVNIFDAYFEPSGRLLTGFHERASQHRRRSGQAATSDRSWCHHSPLKGPPRRGSQQPARRRGLLRFRSSCRNRVGHAVAELHRFPLARSGPAARPPSHTLGHSGYSESLTARMLSGPLAAIIYVDRLLVLCARNTDRQSANQ
jgi:hypothetical protein